MTARGRLWLGAGPALIATLVLPLTASAHAIGARYDLPVPLWLYLYAGGGIVLLSFVLVALFVGRTESDQTRESVTVVPAAIGTALRIVGGALGLVITAVALWAGFAGSQQASANIAAYIVWIFFWAGLVMVGGLAGNVFTLLSPWNALHHIISAVRRRPAGAKGPLSYPPGLGLWPAIVGFLFFTWFELASGLAATPRLVALAAVLYTVITLVGMQLFGRDPWREQADPFHVLFRYLERFAPIGTDESRPNCLRLRWWGTGLLQEEPPGWSRIAFVILMLSTLAFDGIEATPAFNGLSASMLGTFADRAAGLMFVKTAGLLAVSALFLAVYVVFARLVVAMAERVSRQAGAFLPTATQFSLTLIPIALVYNAAHNYSYLVLQSQLIIPRLSDPLGQGWNLFGTLDYQVSFALAGAATVWYAQVLLIVVGHVVAVYVSHVRALQVFRRAEAALVSQYPMLLLMIGYTMTSLWILAQPVTQGGG